MLSMNYIEIIQKLNSAISSCTNLQPSDLTVLPAVGTEKKIIEGQSSKIHPNMINFYQQVKSYVLKWESKIELPEKIYGQVKIIEASKALSDWKEIVYFEDDSPLKHFKIFDYFMNEACSGFYTLASKTSSAELIYYYDFSDKPTSLQLTIEEYFTMMFEAKGFLYWQRVLRDHLLNEESAHTVLMKKDFNKIFPDFNFDSFISKFNELQKTK